MTSFLPNVKDELVRYFRHLGSRVERAVRSLPQDKLWTKPFPFGNSWGHLVLHLTGNLNHYVGHGIAGTDYVRNRPLEFTDPSQPPAPQVLQRFGEAIDLVVRTIEGMKEDDFQRPTIDADRHPIQTHFGLLLV